MQVHTLWAALTPKRSRRLMTVLTILSVLALADGGATTAFADNSTGCDFAATGTTQSCSNPLTGSTFAGGDGNLLTSPTTFGATDWQNVAGLNHGIDNPSGTGDNAFGQGTKEDNPNVTVVDGSIPPNKSDLTRFYEASETGSNSHIFLYLAWERTNTLGTANMDFEINQNGTAGFTGSTTGPVTLNRTAGDLLVTYDFTNGGGKPTLGLLTWLTAAAGNTASQCFSSNSLPCWGAHQTLNGSQSIGAVNNLDAVTDPLFPSEGNYINPVPALQFGETAIDLTAAGVFSAGVCKAFGSAFLKSRSSTSFTAEVKDFIAPIGVNISNCGTVTIIKQTDPRGINQNFGYTSTLSGTTTTTGSTPCPASFTLNDSGNSTANSTANTSTCYNVPIGSYTVTEGAEPAGFVLESLTCTATGSGSGQQDGTNPAKADITIAAGDDTVTCTYTNKQQLGAIEITKTSIKADKTPLAGAKFTIKDPSGNPLPGGPFTTNSSGVVCVDGLTTLGDYTVQESSAPTGYAIDDSTVHTVTVTGSNAKCTDSTFTGQSLSFTDTPLTDISVSASSEVSGGTQSQITCTDSNSANIGNSPQGYAASPTVTATGLKPGTYTCTIVVDP